MVAAGLHQVRLAGEVAPDDAHLLARTLATQHAAQFIFCFGLLHSASDLPAQLAGRTTIRSIGHIKKLQRLLDNDADFVTPEDMLAELREDNIQLAAYMRETHDMCSELGGEEIPQGI